MAMMLSDVIASFLEWAEGTLSDGTCREYKRHFSRFVAHVGNLDVDELRAHHLLRWGKTWHQIQALQRLFNWLCEDAELVNRNPFKRVKRPPTGQRNRVITRQQCLMLMRDASWQFRDYLLALRETIARPQEVRALQWEWLQWPGGPANFKRALLGGQAMFVLERYKSRDRVAQPNKPRIIVVSVRLGRLLLRLASRRGDLTGNVFLNTEGRPWSRNALRLQMRRGRRRLGLGADHRGEQICCYTFRHTMATNAAVVGVKDKMLAEIMGHTSTRTVQRYQHLDVEHLSGALAKVRFPRVGPL